MDTPFGSITTPNITPDRATGIGAWSEDEFYRALHSGIGRRGENLYPAMPYPWYTLMPRDDVNAVRAYLLSLPPVVSARLPNNLAFPFNVRAGISAWRELFFTPGPFQPDPSATPALNRGAYLVNGPGHCGECHNSRALVGNAPSAKPLQGMAIDHWYAPNITADLRTGIGSWSQEQLVTYFRTGVAEGKGIAAGPMAQVIHDGLSMLTEADLQAMAKYLKSTTARSDYRPVSNAPYRAVRAPGAETYLNYCASCHGVDGKGLGGAVPALHGLSGVIAKGPEDVIRVILGGLPASGKYAPMPPIGAGMSDQEVADAANYVRQSWNNSAPATAQAGAVDQLRKSSMKESNGLGAAICAMDPAPALAKVYARPASPTRHLLQGIDDANLPQRVNEVAASAHAEGGNAPRADVVNAVTMAYCSVLAQNSSLTAEQKALQLGHFGAMLYTRMISGAPL